MACSRPSPRREESRCVASTLDRCRRAGTGLWALCVDGGASRWHQRIHELADFDTVLDELAKTVWVLDRCPLGTTLSQCRTTLAHGLEGAKERLQASTNIAAT